MAANFDFMTASIKKIKSDLSRNEPLYSYYRGKINGITYRVQIKTGGSGYRFDLEVGDKDFEGEFDKLQFLVGWLRGKIEKVVGTVETYKY